MRLFRAAIPANPIEYLVLMLATYAVAFWAVFVHLDLVVDLDQLQASYVARNLPITVCIVVAVLGFQTITAARRLTHAQRGTTQAVVVAIPLIGVAYAASLMFLAASKKMGGVPVVGDPLDPGEWDKHQNGPSGGLTFQGKPLELPGDQQRAA